MAMARNNERIAQWSASIKNWNVLKNILANKVTSQKSISFTVWVVNKENSHQLLSHWLGSISKLRDETNGIMKSDEHSITLI